MNLSFHDRIRVSYYKLYLKKLIYKYNLQDKIIFLGELNEEQMRYQFLKTNVFVSPSAIENSSNSMGEAMLLGCPIVASNVGGTKSILRDGIDGFLYPFNEPYMLAYYVKKIFKSDDIARNIGDEARKHALVTHDPENNLKKLIDIYDNLLI